MRICNVHAVFKISNILINDKMFVLVSISFCYGCLLSFFIFVFCFFSLSFHLSHFCCFLRISSKFHSVATMNGRVLQHDFNVLRSPFTFCPGVCVCVSELCGRVVQPNLIPYQFFLFTITMNGQPTN